MNIEVKTGLSSIDFKLYNFLKKNGDNWILQKDIALAMPDVFPCSKEDMADFHNSSARHAITNSIRKLNASGYVHKIILTGAKGVKIANSKEFDIYINSNLNAAVRRINRLRNLANKAGKNNQFRLKLSQHQKDLFEAFID